MDAIKTNRSASLNLAGVNANTLKRWLETIPAQAALSVHVLPRDRPFDAEVTTITASWTQDFGSPTEE